MDVLKDLFSTLIGAATPEVRGLAGKFIDEVVSNESERLFDRGIRPRIESEINAAGSDDARSESGELAAAEKEPERGLSEPAERSRIREEIENEEEDFRKQDAIHLEEERAEHPEEEAPG